MELKNNKLDKIIRKRGDDENTGDNSGQNIVHKQSEPTKNQPNHIQQEAHVHPFAFPLHFRVTSSLPCDCGIQLRFLP